MKWKDVICAQGGLVQKLALRYKWILLVIVVGIFLLALPNGDEKTSYVQREQNQRQSFDLAQTEEKFAKALAQIEGAGEVTVVLSIKSGTRSVIAEDRTYAEKKEGFEEESAAVVLSRGSGMEEAVTLQEIYPLFQGALVISSGGDQAAVRLKLTEACAALTGLGADKISICHRGK